MAAVVAAVLVAVAPLTGCGGSAASAPTPATAATAHQAAPDDAGSSDAPDKGMFTKNIMLCFDNRSGQNITWGFGTKSTTYAVSAGETTCHPWDGVYFLSPPNEFDVSFRSGYGSLARTGTILATNPAFGYPVVEISYQGERSEQSGLRADARRDVNLSGRQFGVNRYPDHDLTWYSSCGQSCLRRNTESVKHLEVVFYPDAAGDSPNGEIESAAGLPSASGSAEREAALYRSTNLCILNSTANTITVTFPVKDTQQGDGDIAPGAELCAEGTFIAKTWDVEADLTINGEWAGIGVKNNSIDRPGGAIYRNGATTGSDQVFSIGGSVSMGIPDDNGALITLTREPDTDWIEFQAVVQDRT